ncbi:phosphotransferase enzyme family protein [Hirsutella rhossiliensis]|uniref:Phosphotransferase enzyme family domain-containing protein n=1 Tax=Hirsutella rhossiliensis TaxID=111463 RepID=A0A9P8SNA5_9HYPO|nr:phosphotransferase enzyme family domain-containing protein [Hirsutella rhossiliensis]KAH0968851.1 phosphotransferase enzyme family domain-containing protein [Hirsutella rhossiliensis]
MRLVQEHTPDVPIPRVHGSLYRYNDGAPYYGELFMDFVPGRTLKSTWAELDEACKDRICQDIWDLVARIRSIPPPDDLGPGLYRTVDGSPSRDPLLGSGSDIPPCDLDDDALRNRIYARYVTSNGLSYLFTHGDIGPRNIIVDENCHIAALLDWESSGWFPDYWEFAQMMKFCDPLEHEWQRWMDRTRPEVWDIRFIQKARRVLF